MLRIDTLTADELVGAELADVVALLVARDSEAFREQLAAKDPAPLTELRSGFERTFGWAPPEEFQKWLAIEGALGLDTGEADYWKSGDRSLFLDFFNAESPRALEALTTGSFVPQNAEELLAGLFRLSEDASGDRVLASLLPDPLGLLRVHAFSHERGNLGKAQSIKSFLLSGWASEEKPEKGGPPGDVGRPRYEELLAVADAADETLETMRRTKQPGQRIPDSQTLYQRSRWLIRMVWGRPSPSLAEHLTRAPGMTDWEAERPQLTHHPVLANYWMLAHYFLSNDAACAEAVAAGRQAPGLLTQRLAELVENLRTTPREARLGELGPEKLTELRRIARAEAQPGQLAG
ncbi:hypothetical protein [Cystobacter fuscus]|uniref:hypothetical protein n=1 Tax=Cystobacter fuscus TaxID=43 RepID=UPI002B29E06C|nr:hypothetical protein F0U63_05355 [Cystobacter fuscus]